MKETLKVALEAVEDKKALDVVILDISGIASFATHFLLCSGDSSRQIQAIVDEVEKRLKNQGIRPKHIEGYRNAEWVLMDYLDLVVHVFSKNARVYYDPGGLGGDGKRLDTKKLLKPRTAARKPAKKVRPS